MSPNSSIAFQQSLIDLLEFWSKRISIHICTYRFTCTYAKFENSCSSYPNNLIPITLIDIFYGH